MCGMALLLTVGCHQNLSLFLPVPPLVVTPIGAPVHRVPSQGGLLVSHGFRVSCVPNTNFSVNFFGKHVEVGHLVSYNVLISHYHGAPWLCCRPVGSACRNHLSKSLVMFISFPAMKLYIIFIR
jgi:hypothetical protein